MTRTARLRRQTERTTVKTSIKRLICAAAAFTLLGTFACGGSPEASTDAPVTEAPVVSMPAPSEAEEEIVVRIGTPSAAPTDAPERTPSPTDTPAPTPVPSPVRVTIGAVGDVMIPRGLVSDARVPEIEEEQYDFHTLFAPFAKLFSSVDLMCGNLETPLAGAQAGYSAQKDEKTGLFSFNAPDSVVDVLKEYGVDMLTTANNHSMDKGAQGLYRTIGVIRDAGLYQTGTYYDAADRQNPCIVEINDVRIGFVAATRLMNHAYIDIGRAEERTAIGYLVGSDESKLDAAVLEDIERVRNAGAEFIILFAHWDYENDNQTAANTKNLARQLFEAGADCIVGSHPHRIKGAEFMTVQRADGPYTGLVLYSLGNFTANNTFTMMVGLFAQLTLEKNYETGKVTLCDAAVLPTVTLRRKTEGTPQFAVMPVYADPSMITGLDLPLTDSEIETIAKARELAQKRLGTVAGLRVLDAPEQ